MQESVLKENNRAGTKFEIIVLVFTGLQVIIDLLTTLSVKVLEIDISFGMLIRFGFLVVVLLYCLRYGNKFVKLYFGILALFFIGQFLYVILTYDANVFTNLRFYLRTAFFPFCILLFYAMFSKMTVEHRKVRIQQFLDILNGLLLLIGIVFLISFITNSYLPMYRPEDGRLGSQAWFLSGNEISSTMLVLSGIPLYQYYSSRGPMGKNRRWFALITLALQILTIVLLGTKASIILLLVLLAMMVYGVIWSIVRKQHFVPLLGITVLALAGTILFGNQIPGMQNIIKQKALQDEINTTASQTEGGPVDEQILQKHNAAGWEDTGEFIGSITLTFSKNDVSASGYFYPCYADIGHPDFIEKTIIFEDSDHKRYIYPLTDTYNPNVENLKEEQYSSAFSGVSGNFSAKQFQQGNEYTIFIGIKTDGFYREYNPGKNLQISIKNYEYTADYNDGTLKIGQPNNHVTDTSSQSANGNAPKQYNLWFSARDTRLSQLLQRDFSIADVLFGTGYVANYANLNGGTGLEMDFIEIFITFGLIGGILYFLVYLFLLAKGIGGKIRKSGFTVIFKPQFVLFVIPLLVSAGSAFMAGHTFLTPSVAFQASLVVTLFAFVDIKSEAEKTK